jgi:hypothetical protein
VCGLAYEIFPTPTASPVTDRGGGGIRQRAASTVPSIDFINLFYSRKSLVDRLHCIFLPGTALPYECSILHLCFTFAIAQSVQRCARGWTIGTLGFVSRRGLGIFLFITAFQNGSGAHPASYPMGTGGSFPGDKAARA